MSQMTNFLEGTLIDHVLRNTSYTSPTTVYVSLHTSNPTETGSVDELAVANGYARESVAFGADSNGVTLNTGAVNFTASGASWGSITHFAIWDASSGGNPLLYAALDTARTVGDGDSIGFAVSALSVTFS